jgi:SAM-dependent methyltransferase
MRTYFQRLTGWLLYNWMYLGRPPWDTGVTPPELEEFIANHPPGQAVDLGCGTGTNLLALARAGWLVTGVDFALQAVAQARRRLEEDGIPGEVRVGDVSRLESVQGAYDLVLDIGCYHGLAQSSRPAYRRNLEIILKSGGHYLLYAHLLGEGDERRVGVSEAELAALCRPFQLEARRDSLDRWERAAVWVQLRNQAQLPGNG